MKLVWVGQLNLWATFFVLFEVFSWNKQPWKGLNDHYPQPDIFFNLIIYSMYLFTFTKIDFKKSTGMRVGSSLSSAST